LSKALALIIEDEPDLSAVFAEALAFVGLDTEVIGDGLVARERLAVIQPGIVILDLHLPHVSGLELLAFIHDQEHLQQTPVIVVTADVKLAKTLENQANLVLVKPITFAQMAQFAAQIAKL
jgi:DNA-binding response OmpR family regulator